MLEIEDLSDDQCLSIDFKARDAFKVGAYRTHPSADDPVPTHEGWLLAYVATRRPMPRAWAAAAFATLAEETAYAARVRGYLLCQGTQALAFDGEP